VRNGAGRVPVGEPEPPELVVWHEFLDQRKELSLLKPDVCIKQRSRRIKRLSIDDAAHHGDLEFASEPFELHVLDACLAEGSRLRRDVPEEKREELFFLIPKVDTLFVPEELPEVPGRRKPSRSISVRGSTAQPHCLHESVVMVARERDQGGVALHSTTLGCSVVRAVPGEASSPAYTGRAMESEALACRIEAGLSTSQSAREAATEAARAARGDARGEVDLAFLFLSPAHLDEVEAAAEAVHEELAPRHLLGCVAEGVVAGVRELEQGPALAVWAGSLPGAEVECFHAAAVQTEDGIAVAGFPELDDPGLVALLVDPFTFPAGSFLTSLNEAHERVPLVGGIATGGGRPGAQTLILDDAVHSEGAVGAVVSGPGVFTVVSQGCRPIGHEAVITRCEGNRVDELAGKPALERLRTEIATLSSEEQALAARGLLVGLVIDENRPEYDAGDFLMRGLLGADEASGALVLGETVRVGQTLRFFVRDASSADADLQRALTGALRRGRPAGALLFTCNGRGTNMFPAPDHDARVVAAALGTKALAGFFCGGEIGPVGGKAFLHGFTATLAIFLEP
jgi:small ligand-binding sensory domain FIST